MDISARPRLRVVSAETAERRGTVYQARHRPPAATAARRVSLVLVLCGAGLLGVAVGLLTLYLAVT